MAKINKKALRISGIILLVFIGLVLGFNSIVVRIIEKKIDGFLVKEQLKHYHIQYSGVGFNLLNRSVSLTGFKYLPDSIFLDSLDRSGFNAIAPEITVDRLMISGIDFTSAIKENILVIKKITIKKPVIKLYKFNGKLPPASKNKKTEISLKDSVKLVGIKGVSVGTIVFKESKFEVYNYKKKKFTLTSNDISIFMHGLNLESGRHDNDYFYPTLQDASLVAKDNILKLGNNLYEIAFKQLTVDLKQQALIFKGFHYRPLYSKNAFSRRIKFQRERFEMKAGEIGFTGGNYYRFLTKNEIKIKKISISNASINLYRDKRVPFNHNQRPLLPNQLLKRIKGKFIIDTVEIKNIRFEYSEKTDLRNQPLIIYFTGLSGYMTNISNIPYLWRENSMKVTLKGRLMKKASLDMQLVFPLAAKSDTFYFSGAVYGPVSFSVFNPAIYPAAGLKFDGGILDKLTFRGSANPSYSSGTMMMLYHDMSLQAMKKKDEQATNRFLSWGVNSFVRKNNPRKGEGKEAKAASMFFERDVEKGFGNFFWKTLFSGMKATMLPSVNTTNQNKQSITRESKTGEK